MKFGIHLSPEAIKAALLFQESTPEYKSKYLRLYFAGKGCDGFEYGVSFDDKESQDIVFDWGSIQVIVDSQTLPFVEGSVIDWVDDERGKGFLVNNPGHRKFRGKFYKKDNWQERLLTKNQQSSPNSSNASDSIP
jgi:iron-sulfur cluster assembly accessory protein